MPFKQPQRKFINSCLSVVCGGADPVDGVWCEVVDGDRVGLGLKREVGEGKRLVLILNQDLEWNIKSITAYFSQSVARF